MPDIRLIRALAATGVSLFIALIVWSSLEMNLWAGLSASADSRWGILTLVDVYTGLILFTAFIAWRERSLWRVGLWFLALITLGNLATLAYVLVASRRLKSTKELFQPVPGR